MTVNSAFPSYGSFLDLILEYVPLDRIIEFCLTEAKEEYLHDLLDKNNAGTLTPTERAALAYISEHRVAAQSKSLRSQKGT